jgi:hypothetical protein
LLGPTIFTTFHEAASSFLFLAGNIGVANRVAPFDGDLYYLGHRDHPENISNSQRSSFDLVRACLTAFPKLASATWPTSFGSLLRCG